jgi:hypothetical protein
MDARTPDKLLQDVDGKDLAIGIQLNAQVGANRTITLTLGVPLAVDLSDLHKLVDKLMSVTERQNDKGLLEQARIALETARKNIQTNLEQKATFVGKSELEWVASGRQGPFKPSKSQQAQLDNWDTTSRNLKDNVMPRLERDIKELEARINAGA